MQQSIWDTPVMISRISIYLDWRPADGPRTRSHPTSSDARSEQLAESTGGGCVECVVQLLLGHAGDDVPGGVDELEVAIGALDHDGVIAFEGAFSEYLTARSDHLDPTRSIHQGEGALIEEDGG